MASDEKKLVFFAVQEEEHKQMQWLRVISVDAFGDGRMNWLVLSTTDEGARDVSLRVYTKSAVEAWSCETMCVLLKAWFTSVQWKGMIDKKDVVVAPNGV